MHDISNKNIYLDGKYFEVFYPEHPKAKQNGCVRLHILIAEEMLGRYLQDQETVHHIDGNTQNNDKTNLMVFATNSDHINYHKMCNTFPRGEYILTYINGVYRCQTLQNFMTQNPITSVNGRKVRICPYCGNYMSYSSLMCTHCRGRASRKVKRPDRHTLKAEIRKTPMTQLAKKYGVSDNAIRKWCRTYGLPSKASEIKQYSNQDWITI